MVAEWHIEIYASVSVRNVCSLEAVEGARKPLEFIIPFNGNNVKTHAAFGVVFLLIEQRGANNLSLLAASDASRSSAKLSIFTIPHFNKYKTFFVLHN